MIGFGPDGMLAQSADEIDAAAQRAIEGRFVPGERHERTVFTNAQRPSNRGVNAGGKPWQDGPPQGHRPLANEDAAFGAELAGHEGHSEGGGATHHAGLVSPTFSDTAPPTPTAGIAQPEAAKRAGIAPAEPTGAGEAENRLTGRASASPTFADAVRIQTGVAAVPSPDPRQMGEDIPGFLRREA